MSRVGAIYSNIESYFDQHSEQLFILKALALVALLKFLEHVFYLWWVTILVFSPVFVFWLLRIISIHQDKSIFQVLAENLTLIPAPYLEQDQKNQASPWVTYSLILANVLIYYLVMPHLPEDVLGNLVFVPNDLNFVSALLSQLTNLFLHADGWHLWGNMAFLWAIGTVLEKRLGHGWLFALYLAAGCASNLLFLVAGLISHGYLLSALGASGAISGLMGVYAVRCYFKTMVFPFPVLGLFSFVVPISLKVRMNSLVIIGLFFWVDLSSGIDQALGKASDGVAYAAHVGGLLTGVFLAYGMRLGIEALQEKRLDTARRALSGKDWLGAETGEAVVREYLQKNDSDSEALLLLGRQVSKYSLPEEGRELYQRAIVVQLKRDIKEALSTYREYFHKYWRPLKPDLQLRLAVIAEWAGDDDLAARSLEALLEQKSIDFETRKKCLFHCCRLCKKMGHIEAAEMYQERLATDATS